LSAPVEFHLSSRHPSHQKSITTDSDGHSVHVDVDGIEQQSNKIPFDITPKTGIVYVSDPHLLFANEKRRYELGISWKVRAGADVSSSLQDDVVVLQGLTELVIAVVDPTTGLSPEGAFQQNSTTMGKFRISNSAFF
jgi:hypothetical protein